MTGHTKITGRIALLGVFTALAFILGFIESLIPPFTGIPGVKAGFANIVTMAALYLLKVPANSGSSAATTARSDKTNGYREAYSSPQFSAVTTAHSDKTKGTAQKSSRSPRKYDQILNVPSLYSLSCALGISAVRILLGGITYHGMSAMIYGLAGAFCSLIVMFLLSHTGRFSVTAVSVAGGVSHNLAQLILAVLLLGNAVFYYVPLLIVSGLAAGLVIGIISAVLVTRLSVLL